MNKAVIVIRPRLMSPCVCRYCLVLGAGVSHITQLKQGKFRPYTLLFLLGSSLYPCRPSTPQTHPSPTAINALSHSGWWADLLSTGNREIEMITLSLHSRAPSSSQRTHLNSHEKPETCMQAWNKKDSRRSAHLIKYLENPQANMLKRSTQTHKIPMINTSCPTAKSILELCCIRSTKPRICRQSWRVKPRLYLLNAN